MKVLDVCCGGEMFYFDKDNPALTTMDIRSGTFVFCEGREIEINPDIIGDFRDIPFKDNSYDMVIFDPPHLKYAGYNGWQATKYGVLDKKTWKDDIAKGFSECFRVLRAPGTLIFKWNEQQISIKDVLGLVDRKPLFGNRRGKTIWLVFIKDK